jgi:hypothetical protein
LNFKIWQLDVSFLNSKWCQIKTWWIPKFHNSSISTNFIQPTLSYEKVVTIISSNLTHSFLNYVSEHSINEWCTISLSQIKNDPNKVCRAWRVMKLWYSSLLHLKSFRVSKHGLKLSLLKTIQIFEFSNLITWNNTKLNTLAW